MRLARIGLQVGGPYGFALAGGHAVAAHGILQRPSEDVDLFADWDRRADFPAAVNAMIAAYRADGLEVETELRNELIARLHVTEPDKPDEVHRVELVANWRIQPPVHLGTGGTQALTSGYQLPFRVGAGFVLAALVVAAAVLRTPPAPRSTQVAPGDATTTQAESETVLA
ncbi:nucleotidyl transferase AbiEii/AbiGii toxin family protein [Frankia sp. AiPa1]|uniref:nucleotidyl transferase AbiEii/AbiGii toxin family protein n=1 Tax=Frankia sp. AiPa1 TaxID=573492 RepID=UPI00202B8865|nr:nucleotidyl transferase AbiEii/AbiGii toxin family protein [Frankia sp. AiPa1]MCL9762168.1 nucleotidyl transferase AbiEii/AbiGii toxin family protein [Frankia sp. AiPa1]